MYVYGSLLKSGISNFLKVCMTLENTYGKLYVILILEISFGRTRFLIAMTIIILCFVGLLTGLVYLSITCKCGKSYKKFFSEAICKLEINKS